MVDPHRRGLARDPGALPLLLQASSQACMCGLPLEVCSFLLSLCLWSSVLAGAGRPPDLFCSPWPPTCLPYSQHLDAGETEASIQPSSPSRKSQNIGLCPILLSPSPGRSQSWQFPRDHTTLCCGRGCSGWTSSVSPGLMWFFLADLGHKNEPLN